MHELLDRSQVQLLLWRQHHVRGPRTEAEEISLPSGSLHSCGR